MGGVLPVINHWCVHISVCAAVVCSYHEHLVWSSAGLCTRDLPTESFLIQHLLTSLSIFYCYPRDFYFLTSIQNNLCCKLLLVLPLINRAVAYSLNLAFCVSLPSLAVPDRLCWTPTMNSSNSSRRNWNWDNQDDHYHPYTVPSIWCATGKDHIMGEASKGIHCVLHSVYWVC